MGLLGTLLSVGMMAYSVWLGYNDDQRYFLLLFLPVLFVLGQGITRSNKSSNFFGNAGGPIRGMIATYLTGVVLAGICYAIGVGLMEILKLKPPQ